MWLEAVTHFVAWQVTSYGWLLKSNTLWVKVLMAMDVCGSVRNMGELHGAH